MNDIHGKRKKIDAIMRKIKLKPKNRLYVLVDLIDRGKDGIRIMLDLMKLDNATVMRGNHEPMMLKPLEPTANMMDIKLWYQNHVIVTFNDYLVLTHTSINKYSGYNTA